MSGKVVGGLLGGTPTIHVAKKQLAYPLYGADFDPLNHHFLLVGGGGGSSSTGVPNRITLLDTSNRSELKEVSDIELAPDEDSVVSLAVADSHPDSLLAYAGINSSVKDQEAGKNEHFRSFRVPLPARRKKDANDNLVPAGAVTATKPLARTAIFRSATGPKNECYQRVLRLSPPIRDRETAGEKTLPTTLRKRLVTIASGLAKQNEVVVFPAEEYPSATTKVTARINLEKVEASDVDLTCANEDGTAFAVAYTTDTELFLQRLGDQKDVISSEPVAVYETTKGPNGRSKIRALRFLTSRYVVLLQNRVNRGGVELMVLKLSQDFAQAQQVVVKYLKNMKQAVGLDTCTLTASQDGSQQYIIAVAGQDSSVQIHTLDYVAGSGMAGFKQYADIIELHNGPITRMTFSNFIGPDLPISSQTPPQYVRLATVGVDKNVVVQTLPLRPYPAAGSGKTMPRYVLIAPREIGSFVYNVFMSLITLTVVLLAMVTFLELRGVMPPVIGGAQYLPKRWQEQYGRAYPYAHDNPGPVIPQSMPDMSSAIDKIKLSEATPVIEKLELLSDQIKLADASTVIGKLQEMQSAIPSTDDIRDKLVDLVSEKESSDEHENKAVIIRDLEHIGREVTAELQHEADIVKEGTLKKWENLNKKEQKTWKEKLKSAGHWTEKQGEAVLKGVFFGQVAGIVGEVVRG